MNRPIALAMEAAWRQRFDTEADIHADNYAIVAQVQEGVDAAALLSLITSANLEALLRDSLEGSGFFGARFRECAGRALLLTRQRFNQRMPLWLTRMQAKKLLTAIRHLDNFPILLETWRTCLGDEFDMQAARDALAALETGEIGTSITEVAAPTPFAAGVAYDQLNRYMYADDTPERRAPSALSEDLIRQAVHDQRLRPSIAPGVIDDFESKAQRSAPGYCAAGRRGSGGMGEGARPDTGPGVLGAYGRRSLGHAGRAPPDQTPREPLVRTRRRCRTHRTRAFRSS